jgi:hypothetical protein
MTAHGDVIRGHEVLPFYGLWQKAKEWSGSQSARDKTFLFVAALTAVLGLGLLIYGFHHAMHTLDMANLPQYWSVKPF